MKFAIKWTSRAEKSYGDQLEYLFNKWGNTSTVNFMNLTEKVLEHISETPRMYHCHDKKENLHRCVLNKQVSLYYKVEQDTVFLVVFWPNRRDKVNMGL